MIFAGWHHRRRLARRRRSICSSSRAAGDRGCWADCVASESEPGQRTVQVAAVPHEAPARSPTEPSQCHRTRTSRGSGIPVRSEGAAGEARWEMAYRRMRVDRRRMGCKPGRFGGRGPRRRSSYADRRWRMMWGRRTFLFHLRRSEASGVRPAWSRRCRPAAGRTWMCPVRPTPATTLLREAHSRPRRRHRPVCSGWRLVRHRQWPRRGRSVWRTVWAVVAI